MELHRKKVVFVGMSGGFGPLSQVVPILKQLQIEGYEVYCSIAPSSAEIVRREGFHYVELPEIEPPRHLTPKGPIWWDLDHYWSRFGYLDPQYVRNLCEVFIEAIKNCRPDIIITQFSPPTTIAAKHLGIPLVSITQACLHPSGKGGRVSYWEELPTAYERRSSAVVNEIMEDMGLQPIERMEDLNVGEVTLIPSFPEFDPIESEEAIYMGPLQWETSLTDRSSITFTQKSRRIFVYPGHMHDSAGPSGLNILRNVVEAFNDRLEYEIIVGLGFGQLIPELPQLSRNIHIVEWVSAPALIKQCDLIVHHGGHGSCMLGLTQGVPAVIIPTFSEREFNARQMKELGAGSYIKPDELSPERLREEIDRGLEDSSLRHRAEGWSTTLKARQYEGVKQAVEWIEKLVV